METKHAFISGGGSGIGLAIAKRLQNDGRNITVAGRNEEQLKESGFNYVVMDVTNEESVSSGFSAMDPVDILISNAGAAQTAPLLKTPLSMWQAMLDVNLTGAFLCAKAGIPNMIDQGWGRFIVIASTSALKGYAYTGAYTASKHGAMGLVKTLAIELAKSGVTANAVCPGFTETDLLSRSIENIVKTTKMNEEQALKALLKDNPMGRAIQPEAVAASVSWLCSADADSTNGQPIVIDGGELAS